MMVVCMIMTTGSAITKAQQKTSDQRHCALQKNELLHSVSPGNTSRYDARRRGFRPLAILATQRSESDLSDARAGKLVGDFGEGLGVYVCPPCGRTAWEESRTPVCGDCRELDWDFYAGHISVVRCLAGSVCGVVSASMAERKDDDCGLLEDVVGFGAHDCGLRCGLV